MHFGVSRGLAYLAHMSCWNRLGSVGLLEAAAGNGTLSYRRNIWKDKLSERVPMNCILIRHESWKQCWFVGLCSNILRVRLRCAWCIRAQVVIPCRSRGLGLRRSSTILEADTGSSGTLAHCMQDHPTPLQSSMVEKSKHLKMALSIMFC